VILSEVLCSISSTIHLYYFCHITYNKNENINGINEFSNYFSIIASGRKFGPFQEYRKNHMSTKWTFQAYLRGPFLATRMFRHSLN
jgi:hypothetical protein